MTDSRTAQQLSHQLLDAFELEYWSGRHSRPHLLAAPLRVLRDVLDSAEDPSALLTDLLGQLER
jgi:hypothetical protein